MYELAIKIAGSVKRQVNWLMARQMPETKAGNTNIP
jgi:hypothetical protein